jgi:TnsA endonuclease N terminal/TnsA endonuclease C terminal
MVKHQRQSDPARIEQAIQEGWGQGKGQDYKPWLQVKDVPSQGVSSRVKGWTTRRVHEFLSQQELYYFYLLDWSSQVVDIREQYPLLPLAETLEIAEQLDIAHPAHPRTKTPVVMTTDFLLTVAQGNDVTDHSRTVKPAQQLSSRRTIEKLEIERCYWQRRKISWGIVTEREIPEIFAKNVAWVHPFHTKDSLSLSAVEIEHIVEFLNRRLQQQPALAILATDCDDQLGLPPGSSLAVARHLFATRRWQIDMFQPIPLRTPLVLDSAPRSKMQSSLGAAS